MHAVPGVSCFLPTGQMVQASKANGRSRPCVHGKHVRSSRYLRCWCSWHSWQMASESTESADHGNGHLTQPKPVGERT